jgi:monoamine oxidase
MDQFEFPRLDRRQFLRRMGLATGAALTTSLLDDLNAAEKPEKPVQVVIIGAGMAGLCAAYELERRGHSVVILEAEGKHVGGRVRTLRFEDGLYGEAGAMRIPLRHELTRHYIKEFGVPLRKFVHSNPKGYYYVRGHRERIEDVKNLNKYYALAEGERGKTPDDLWADVMGRRMGALADRERADLSSDSFETSAVRSLDQLSLQQLCEMDGLSQEAIEMLAVAYGQETLMPTAATEHMREEREQVWTQDFHEIVGGTDRLATAFVERLKSKPRMGCEVIRLEQDPLRRRAAAVYLERGKQQRVEADFVLCTLPLPVLARLETDPAFSGPKQRAIRQVNYDSSTKVLAIANRRFWETDDGIFGGGTFTDLPSGTTYYPANNAEAKDPRVSAGPGVMLASYTWGQGARRLGALPHRERSALVIRHLSRVHPQLRQEGVLRRTASWSWDNHRWSGGAFAWYMPGQHTALHRHVITPEGRIYFAGEHASLTHTWIQGALESALRAVREMLGEGALSVKREA